MKRKTAFSLIEVLISLAVVTIMGAGITAMVINVAKWYPTAQSKAQMADQSRLLLLHVNTPGVLATVNGLLADHGVNIEGQLLSTRGSHGYVVTDIASEPTPEVLAALCELPETVRLRVLQ